VLARKRHASTGEEPLDDLQCLRQAVDANAGCVERYARLFVVRRHPAGAQPEIETAVGQQVQRCRFLCQDDWVTVVVVEHQRTDPQPGRRVGRGHEGGDHPQLVAKVIRDVQG